MTALRVLSADSLWQEWNQQQQQTTQVRHVPPEQQQEYARSTSLRQFYLDCLNGKWEPIGIKRVRKKNTHSKERQCLNRWERFTQPPDWPAGVDWPGPSLATLATVGGEWFETVWDRMRAAPLAPDTVRSTRSHLRVLLRHAVTVKALPSLAIGRPVEAQPPTTQIYTPAQVVDLLKSLQHDPDLYAAFWLALHAGLRSVDLFLIRWQDFVLDARGRRLLDFQSHKTGKLQGIPIADGVWDVLKELPRTSEYVFPGLSKPGDHSEKSWPARCRNARFQWHLQRCGITHIDKPWQVARATCNERYESHRPGVGEFILGHEKSGVNARSYRQPTEAVHEAVRTLPPYEQIERQRRLF